MASLQDRKDLFDRILHKLNTITFDKCSEFDSEWSVHMLWMKEIMSETVKTFGSYVFFCLIFHLTLFQSNTLGLPSSTPSSKKARMERTIHVTGGTPFSFFKNFEPSTPSTPFQPSHRYQTRSVAQTPVAQTPTPTTPFLKPALPDKKLPQPKLSISSVSSADESDSGQKKRRRAVNETVSGTRKSARLKEKEQKLSIPCVVEMALKQKAQEEEEVRKREEEEQREAFERAEKLRREKEEREKARLLKEQAEKERLEKEHKERERLERERIEKERAIQEEAARKKAEEERLRREQERLENERREKELEEQVTRVVLPSHSLAQKGSRSQTQS